MTKLVLDTFKLQDIHIHLWFLLFDTKKTLQDFFWPKKDHLECVALVKNPGLDVRGEFWTHTHDVVALVKRMWVLAELKIWDSIRVQDICTERLFFKAIKIITLNMPKKTRAVSHIASKQSFRALEHNLSQSWTCGLSGMPWPWKAWKCRRTPYTTQYFQISVFPHRNSQLWAATKILWQNAPCQEPFFGAVPRSEQTARFGDMFFAGHFLFLDEIDPKMPPSAIF